MRRTPAMAKTAERGVTDEARFTLEFRMLGMITDVPGSEIPVQQGRTRRRRETFWSMARNARVRDAARERMPGWKTVHDAGWPAAAAGRSISYAPDKTLPYWCVWAPTGLYVSDGGAWFTSSTVAAPGKSETFWVQLEGHTVLGGPAAGPFAITWSGGSPFTPALLPGWPQQAGVPDWRARVMGFSNNMLIAAGMHEGGGWLEDKIRWSHPAPAGSLPNLWQPAATNLAGDAVIAGNGLVRAALPMGDAMFVYRDRETWIGVYVGPPYVWDWRRRFKTRGAEGPRAVTEVAGRHFVVSDQDFGYHDGVRWTSLAVGKVRRHLAQRHAKTWPNKGIGTLMYLPWARELWYPIPEEDGLAREVLVYSLDENEFTLRTLAYPAETCDVGSVQEAVRSTVWTGDTESWDKDPTTWDHAEIDYTQIPVFTNSTITNASGDTQETRLRGYEIAINEEQKAVVWRLERLGLDFGDAHRVDTVLEVWPRMTEVGDCWIDVRVGSQMSEREPVAWGITHRMESGMSKVDVDPAISGRLISIEISSSCPNLGRVEGFDVVFARGGSE